MAHLSPASRSTATLQLFFSGSELFSLAKSDPYVVLYRGIDVVGRTEVVEGSANPVWKMCISVDYHFETRQAFKYVVHHDDGKGPGRDSVLVSGWFELGHVVSARRATLIQSLGAQGSISISAQESGASAAGQDTIVLKFAGVSLKKMQVFGKSDPYFNLYRINANGTRQLLHRSNVVKDSLDPVWEPTCAIPVAALIAGADTTRPVIEFECWEDGLFSDDSMGHFVLSFQALMNAAGADRRFPNTFDLMHCGGKDKSYGRVTVVSAQITHAPKFTELLTAGLQINVHVAIDFTASNGSPTSSRSLHHISKHEPSDYMKAISSVCDVLLEYDSDKLVPVTGFGARQPGARQPDNRVSHYFHANGNEDPQVHGVDGVLDAYRRALRRVTLSGPTNFAPTIRAATQQANAAGHDTYTILLILTDGAITDTDATIDAIVAAGTSPLSIIIVGVGSADFTAMNILDGDDERLTDSCGHRAARDLVQFVPFNTFAHASSTALAAEVLQEVPQQVEEWAAINRVNPARFRSDVPVAPHTPAVPPSSLTAV